MYRPDYIPSMNDKFLFHFTTTESLLKILSGMTVKLSNFTNLNDLNETDINCDWNDSLKKINTKKYIQNHCKLISFSQNYHPKDKFCQPGYNHPRMWAQYSDNNKGVCLVINEEKFRSTNK